MEETGEIIVWTHIRQLLRYKEDEKSKRKQNFFFQSSNKVKARRKIELIKRDLIEKKLILC